MLKITDVWCNCYCWCCCRLGDNRAEQQGPPATPITARTGAAAAADTSPLGRAGVGGSKASPATPQSAPRSAFKARTNVSCWPSCHCDVAVC
jgi:hypothetical protein